MTESSLFVQDEWHVDRELTVNFGIRHDAQRLAQPEAGRGDAALPAPVVDASSIRSDYNNFGPRLGLAWSPLNSRFVARAGYAVVYGRTPWPILALAHANDTAGVRGRTIVAFGSDYENPRMRHASTGFEWEWMPNTALSVNYLMVRGDGLPRVTARSIGLPVGPSRVVTYESSGRSRYHAVAVEMTRRFAQGHQYRLAYTAGKLEQTMSDALPFGPATFVVDRTLGLVQPRHRFAGTVIIASNRVADRFSGFVRSLVSDWTLSGVYTAQSSVLLGAERLPAWISADTRLARDIELKGEAAVTLLWEALNLLNRPHRLMAVPHVADPLGPMDARTMRVGARFSF